MANERLLLLLVFARLNLSRGTTVQYSRLVARGWAVESVQRGQVQCQKLEAL